MADCFSDQLLKLNNRPTVYELLNIRDVGGSSEVWDEVTTRDQKNSESETKLALMYHFLVELFW